MRRLPGPAGRPLCDGVKTPRLPLNCFGAGREHKLNLLCKTLRSLRQQMDVFVLLDAGIIGREALLRNGRS